MENTQEQKKSNRQIFIYELIYPAFLGAMLFELVPIKFDIKYLIALFIVVFYLLDYCHLYFYLGKKFSQKQKNTLRYTVFDFLVSLSLFFGFRYIDQNLTITVWCIAFVPLCFLIYSSELKYRTSFYWTYMIIGFIGAISWSLFSKHTNNTTTALIYICAMSVIYGLFTLTTARIN